MAQFNRTPEPNAEIFTVRDYRQRYASYRQDPALRASHEQFPWINVVRFGCQAFHKVADIFVSQWDESVPWCI